MPAPASRPHTSYLHRRVAFLTRHGKHPLVAEPLEHALGCHIIHTDAFDTDALGAFTREVDRAGSQLEAARLKARTGMELLGTPLGLASEGAFDVDPFTGWLPWNTKVLLWLDDERKLKVVGVAQGPASNWQGKVRSWDELLAFAHKVGFPSHRLVLRPAHQDHPRMFKGLDDEVQLRRAFEQCMQQADNATVWTESDLRAFCNPTRQQLIRSAAEDLARKLASLCPACAAPGYAVQKHVPGLPCRACGEATPQACAHLWACASCGHTQEQAVQSGVADPAHCPGCNP